MNEDFFVFTLITVPIAARDKLADKFGSPWVKGWAGLF